MVPRLGGEASGQISEMSKSCNILTHSESPASTSTSRVLQHVPTPGNQRSISSNGECAAVRIFTKKGLQPLFEYLSRHPSATGLLLHHLCKEKMTGISSFLSVRSHLMGFDKGCESHEYNHDYEQADVLQDVYNQVVCKLLRPPF